MLLNEVAFCEVTTLRLVTKFRKKNPRKSRLLRRQSIRHFSDFLHFSTYLTSWIHFELWREQEAEGMNRMMIDKS